MSGVNKVILIGNLGRDPEIVTLPNGQKKARIAMATSEFYKNKNGERIEQTEWHSVIFYRGLAEVVEKYLKKGNAIYVEGRLRTRVWEDKGEKHYFTEIEAQNLNMLGGNGGRKSETPAVEKGEPVLPSVPKNLDKEETFYDPAADALPF